MYRSSRENPTRQREKHRYKMIPVPAGKNWSPQPSSLWAGISYLPGQTRKSRIRHVSGAMLLPTAWDVVVAPKVAAVWNNSLRCCRTRSHYNVGSQDIANEVAAARRESLCHRHIGSTKPCLWAVVEVAASRGESRYCRLLKEGGGTPPSAGSRVIIV